jgi:prepilin-type N-terminal cleavage/methylation domain-containing protein
MRRRHEAGFSFIEIMVVMGIIVVLMGMVAVIIPRITEKSRQTKSADNLRQLVLFSMDEATTDISKWPPVNGKSFTLWHVATGKINRKRAENLSILFSPGDSNYTFEAVGLKGYEGLTKDALRDGTQDFKNLTSYAGRRNKEREHKLTAAELDKTAMVLCDDDDGPLHHAGGLMAAYSNARTEFLEWDELEVAAPEDEKNPEGLLGDNSPHEDLKHMSSSN